MAIANMSVIKAAILKCDDVLDKFKCAYGGYPEMISESFKDIDDSIVFDTFDSRNFEKPDCIDDYQFFCYHG